MTVFDSTQVDVAAKGLLSTPPPGTPPEGEKPPGDGAAKDGGKSAEESRPATTDLISTILDKHGLSSPEELAEFVDRIAERDGQIGDYDPEELLKAKNTLDAYQREWAKAEQEKLKASETPEQTIARLEREAAERENKNLQRAKQRQQSEAARKAVKTFTDVVTSTVKAEKLPSEYVPFIQEFMGVNNPVNDVNIQDRAAVKKLAKDYGIKRMLEFEQVVIKRYRDGKVEIPKVPDGASDQTPVTTDTKPKNLKESRAMAHTLISKLWAPK